MLCPGTFLDIVAAMRPKRAAEEPQSDPLEGI